MIHIKQAKKTLHRGLILNQKISFNIPWVSKPRLFSKIAKKEEMHFILKLTTPRTCFANMLRVLACPFTCGQCIPKKFPRKSLNTWHHLFLIPHLIEQSCNMWRTIFSLSLGGSWRLLKQCLYALFGENRPVGVSFHTRMS